ncbi:hypothetical protein BN12_1320008 [Nostocoides japonicum T1-X7]|uniref:Polyketide cyclase/dehydrase n=1 Tax=Nostocoides japonicum T1-X7 TaxID=1194083 RepID=A0A077LT43_9MICO|nr:SRPBCC family protein [Tetrasphaera japonica]CCH76558.1 hypothetical protein BN12_1320008 [Tetrasphaera japonica T1-X7]
MTFTLRHTSTASPDRVWAVVTDVARHGDHVPATAVHTDAGPKRLGWGFTARTAVGPAHVDDTMVLSVWDPPHRMRVVKVGRMLRGWAEATVEPGPDGGSVLTWRESIVPPGLPRALHGVADRIAGPAYDRVLRSLLATAEEAG